MKSLGQIRRLDMGKKAAIMTQEKVNFFF